MKNHPPLPRPLRRLLPLFAFITLSVPFAAHAADPTPPQKAPDPKESANKVFEWKTADSVIYSWRGPKKYDPQAGVGLTLILHGSNLSHEWGFANHSKDTFRTDDLVVCPDGTTSGGPKRFNFLDAPADVKKIETLITELKAAFKIRAIYIYGHSQGSFFALKYAGEHPDDIDGVVAQASGLWASTKIGPPGHRQAIVFMHGTLDPTVPYAQSIGGFEALQKAGYPMVRLRSLEGWSHVPAESNSPVPHTSQQLAWVEGMTTKDPVRLAVCFDQLADPKNKAGNDWAGLYSLAKHIAAPEQAKLPAPLKARAQKAIAIVEALAKAHATALAAVKPGAPYEKKPWVAHLPIFLRAFPDVPAREELNNAWKAASDAQKTASEERFKAYWAAASGSSKEPEAFEKGVTTLAEGYLTDLNLNGKLVENLATWARDAKKLKLTKDGLKRYAEVFEVLKAGAQAFASINSKAGNP